MSTQTRSKKKSVPNLADLDEQFVQLKHLQKRDVIENIFDPFFTTKRLDLKRGSGLGLSIVHGIIEDHNAFITIDSKVGKGTAFAIHFPISRDLNHLYDNEVDETVGGSERILVVDDDPIQRRVAGQLLERLGYKVHVLSSGERAVKHVKTRPYDLLIMDMVMDGIDGVEAYRRILEAHPDQKAIILSGYAMSNRVEKALKLGAGMFVSKPITQKILAEAVRRELDKKRKKKHRSGSGKCYSV
ncbi:MAG: response regulator [Calditrichaeota bacterium]|nr:response regulator [Calditrichota bacterium]